MERGRSPGVADHSIQSCVSCHEAVEWHDHNPRGSMDTCPLTPDTWSLCQPHSPPGQAWVLVTRVSELRRVSASLGTFWHALLIKQWSNIFHWNISRLIVKHKLCCKMNLCCSPRPWLSPSTTIKIAACIKCFNAESKIVNRKYFKLFSGSLQNIVYFPTLLILLPVVKKGKWIKTSFKTFLNETSLLRVTSSKTYQPLKTFLHFELLL